MSVESEGEKMKLVISPRRHGKTAELIRMAADIDAKGGVVYIVGRNREHRAAGLLEGEHDE